MNLHKKFCEFPLWNLNLNLHLRPPAVVVVAHDVDEVEDLRDPRNVVTPVDGADVCAGKRKQL